MGSQILSGNMTTTTLIISFLVLAITLPHSQGFFLRDRYDSPSSRSSNQTEEEGSLAEDAILGVFDTVTGFTYGLEGIFEQFEDGFKKIRPQSDSTVTKKVSQNAEDQEEEEEDDSTLGSDAVVGLFDSLRNFNRQVGKLVGKVGDTLTDRRGNVERLASNIDSGLKNVGENFQDWKEDNFGISLRRKKETEKEAEDEAEDEDDNEAEAEDSDIELEV